MRKFIYKIHKTSASTSYDISAFTTKNSDTTSLILSLLMVDSSKFILAATSTNLIGDSFSVLTEA
jgi:hypothetical protein